VNPQIWVTGPIRSATKARSLTHGPYASPRTNR